MTVSLRKVALRAYSPSTSPTTSPSASPTVLVFGDGGLCRSFVAGRLCRGSQGFSLIEGPDRRKEPTQDPARVRQRVCDVAGEGPPGQLVARQREVPSAQAVRTAPRSVPHTPRGRSQSGSFGNNAKPTRMSSEAAGEADLVPHGIFYFSLFFTHVYKD